MARIGWLTLGIALGCAEPEPFEALLVQRKVEGGCQLERVRPGQDPRVLGVVPSVEGCRIQHIVLSPDGSRMLLGYWPVGYELDLVSGELQRLPNAKGSSVPDLPPPALHLDGQGAVVWEIPQGDGDAEVDEEGRPSWRAYRHQLHALRDGEWVVEAEVVEPAGSPPSPERLRFQARFASEIAVVQKFPYLKGEMAGPELRAELDEVSGIKPLKWHVDGRFAQPFTSSGMGFPVLLKVGERWQALPVSSAMASEGRVGHDWLIVRVANREGYVYSLATGEQVWKGPAQVSFWPLQVSAP